jgi:aryl-alcohol dehydrogenase-like predicted oxidoreductase
LIPGFATREGTRRYCTRRVPPPAPGHFRTIHGLQVSSVGLGTYLGEDDDATDRVYRSAVALAVESGINLIDSAINYRHQRSERAVGAALSSLIESGTVGREEILVATKGGFIPFEGAAPANPAEYVLRTYVRPGIASPTDIAGGCHCLAPRYLADQLDRSRANLGLRTIDVYYLHNPETQLSAVDGPTFRGRMRAAFRFLEDAVSDGKIRWYGTATWNGYRQPRTAPDFLSLSELVGLAGEVAGDGHHFRWIELPYNLAMTEAFTLANQPLGSDTVTLLDAASQLDVYVTTSASLYQGQLARNLPPIVAEFLPGFESDAQRALQFVRSTPGVGTALVGMRQEQHVRENARVRDVSPLPWDEFRKLFSAA